MAKLIETSAEADEMRTALLFGDLFAAILTNVKNQQGEFWDRATWRGPIKWGMVRDMIKHEREQIKVYGTVVDKRGNYSTGILDEIAQAALLIDMRADELEMVIVLYAERNDLAHVGIDEEAKLGNFDHVAIVLAAMRRQLTRMRLTITERGRYEQVIHRYQRQWFKSIDFRPYDYGQELPKYILNERAEKKWEGRLERMRLEAIDEVDKDKEKTYNIRKWEEEMANLKYTPKALAKHKRCVSA